ncbi:hypothetical protein FOL47_003106 [Perkinsus chesapeaki]|uniref:Uncharacterized protein n=1 Tax=Perkinsus chesapeaki TaxID=330153 RepID=A0A7J6MB69_PERCH|nr:hypothetical protein FOL47_003106 [Perkinsus chesapeaki]
MMMTVIGIPFIFLLLSSGPLYVESTAKSRREHYATGLDIPAGTYTAVTNKNGRISDTLPKITSLTLHVGTDQEEGQRGMLEIGVDGKPPLISNTMPIRKYSRGAIYKDLEYQGRRYNADSFYFDGELDMYFISLYNEMGINKKATNKDMILCKMKEDSTLKIGVWPKRNLPDRLYSSIGGVSDFITLIKSDDHAGPSTPHVNPDRFPVLRPALKRPLTLEKGPIQVKRPKVNDNNIPSSEPEGIPDGLYIISEINDINNGTLGIHTDREGGRWGNLILRTEDYGNLQLQRLPLKLINGMWELGIVDDKQKSDAVNIKKALRLEETTITEHPFRIFKSTVWFLIVGDVPDPVILLQLDPIIPFKS